MCEKEGEGQFVLPEPFILTQNAEIVALNALKMLSKQMILSTLVACFCTQIQKQEFSFYLPYESYPNLKLRMKPILTAFREDFK